MQAKIQVDGKQLEQVQKFKHLGQTDSKEEVTRKLRFALQKPNQCSSN